MRNSIIWSSLTLLLLCHKANAQQPKHMANRVKVDTPYQVRTFEIIDRAVDAAYDGWDAVFENDRPKVVYNAFNIGIDTTYENRKQHRENLLLSMKNRDIPKAVHSPVPIFEEKKMTVAFKNGSFVKIDTPLDSSQQVGKGVIESVFKIEVQDDELDSIFMAKKEFTYNGEVYRKMSRDEFEVYTPKKRFRRTVIKQPGTQSVDDFIDTYADEAEKAQSQGIRGNGHSAKFKFGNSSEVLHRNKGLVRERDKFFSHNLRQSD